MLPFEFIVDGPPVSQQTHNVRRLREWQRKVREAAARYLPPGQAPLSSQISIKVIYFHDGVIARLDNDNMIKPIQDALIGLIYHDDRQITDVRVRSTDLNGSFRVRGMSAILAEGFCRGNEFLYFQIEYAPNHEELL